MKISYNWLQQYLPVPVEIEKLSKILTSIGLEVENIENYESIKGSLQGLIIGKVISCIKHPNADKLSLTTVNIGSENLLHIVCGAPNVQAEQTVVVAPIGTTIYPLSGQPLTMEKRKIRGELSEGMICAEDEIGLSNNHDGIVVLPNDLEPGTAAATYFKPYKDTIIEIGITPNRMDAMSHLGVAKDVLAYLAHHQKVTEKLKLPYNNNFKPDNTEQIFSVHIKNALECPRYAGVHIKNIQVKKSPEWLINYLQTIGVRSINNVVDITNYVLHETGQPLHAFDATKIEGNKIIVQTLAEGTSFLSLDEKERKLTATDIMICDGKNNPMCIGGVFGGLNSGVTENTTEIFLESACFNAAHIRATSMHHNLRTDAAIRFEKGIDISNSINVLKHAALLIKDIAGGEICGNVIDVYSPTDKKQVQLKYHYLKKLSGKNYHPDTVKKILTALDFEIIKEGIDDIWLAVPYNKPDIAIPADIVEEIVRIDGLDNIAIPSSITLSPALETLTAKEALKEKLANYLIGIGYNEILTNSITNSSYYNEETLKQTIHMINSLSAELNVMRPSLLQTGLEAVAFNLNRKNQHIRFFEMGKVYSTPEIGKYQEKEILAIYCSGTNLNTTWNTKPVDAHFYQAKGLVNAIAQLSKLEHINIEKAGEAFSIYHHKKNIGILQQVSVKILQQFDIKQPVFYIEFDIAALVNVFAGYNVTYKEVAKYPAVQRDLALVLDRSVPYSLVEDCIKKLKMSKLKTTRLFDVFESDKLGENKKSFAINFTFLDEEKTLTDKEIDGMMQKLMQQFTKDLQAEIRGL